MYEIGRHGLREITLEPPMPPGLLIRSTHYGTVFAVLPRKNPPEMLGQIALSKQGYQNQVRASELDGNPYRRVMANGSPIILSATALLAWIEKAADRKAFDAEMARRAEKADSEAKAAELQRIVRVYTAAPFRLDDFRTSHKSRHACGGANVKRILAVKFPATVFKVTSQSYSMGSSIDIRWTDGPTTKQVDALTDRFGQCDFDGSQDLETYRKAIWPDVFGGAHYVQTSRSISPARTLQVATEHGYPAARMDGYGRIDTGNQEANEAIERETWKRDFTVLP